MKLAGAIKSLGVRLGNYMELPEEIFFMCTKKLAEKSRSLLLYTMSCDCLPRKKCISNRKQVDNESHRKADKLMARHLKLICH